MPKCRKCGYDYRTEGLKRECEKTPVIEAEIPLGTVFSYGNGIFGILYEKDHVQHQTHITLYNVANTGLKEYSDIGIVPGVLIEAPALNKSVLPVSDKEFDEVKAELDAALSNRKGNDTRYTRPFRGLVLQPLKAKN